MEILSRNQSSYITLHVIKKLYFPFSCVSNRKRIVSKAKESISIINELKNYETLACPESKIMYFLRSKYLSNSSVYMVSVDIRNYVTSIYNYIFTHQTTMLY